MTHYAEELAKLKENLLAMASHAETSVSRAMRALVERDDAVARKVEDDDNILDQFEIEIDDTAIHLLAKAPLATELRLITVAMKISHNLERVGDEATKIARAAHAIHQRGLAPIAHEEIVRVMAASAGKQLHDSLDAFARLDQKQARATIPLGLLSNRHR